MAAHHSSKVKAWVQIPLPTPVEVFMNTTQIGDITEQKFVLYCLERNIPISRPIGNNLQYDFIIEINNILYKIQVKTCRIVGKSVITFNTKSCSKNYNEVVKSDYQGKIDYFATIYNNMCLLIPITEACSGEHRICVGSVARKNQHHYSKYVLDNIIDSSIAS